MAQPSAGFEFIAGPIQRLFKDETGRLAAMLKMLSVLAIRFRRQYMHASTMDWKTPFDTSIPFLEDCLIATSGSDLARSLKALDEHQFAEMSRQNLVSEDVLVGKLLRHWQTLSVSVWECCLALPDLIPHLQECTLVSASVQASRMPQITQTLSNRIATEPNLSPGLPFPHGHSQWSLQLHNFNNASRRIHRYLGSPDAARNRPPPEPSPKLRLVPQTLH